MDEKLISKKKPTYPISDKFYDYLAREGRLIKIPICYDDLLRFQGGISVYDEAGNDTLWISTYYSEFDRVEIDLSLKRMYSILHANGSDMLIPYLSVDAIDYCTFGNSKPFRVKIRNIFNDIYSYLYVKRADASESTVWNWRICFRQITLII